MTDKVKRTVLTPEQRVAKLEAELDAAKAKAEARANKEAKTLHDRRSSLMKRVNEITAKIDDIDTQLSRLGYYVPEPNMVTDMADTEGQVV